MAHADSEIQRTSRTAGGASLAKASSKFIGVCLVHGHRASKGRLLEMGPTRAAFFQHVKVRYSTSICVNQKTLLPACSYLHDQRHTPPWPYLPACLPASQPASQPTHLSTYLPTYLPTYIAYRVVE